VLRARSFEELRDALLAARSMDETVVVHVPVDRYESVPTYESWWDVPVAEVSETDSVRKARSAYEEAVRKERWYVTPPQ
jgi:3D-(3,5/4)-trihydroxycyclohexane-1,2-dione acylhydrolase (decyclizing)